MYLDSLWAVAVTVNGRDAYIATDGGGTKIVDVSSPAAPTLQSTQRTVLRPRGLSVNGNRLYIAGAGVQQPPPTKIASVNTDGAPVKGNPNAPVTMVEFADFQCPFCGRFVSDSLQQIEKKYVDTGQVKFVYEQYPLPFHPNAQPGAMTAECANAQGKFWPMHDKLYATQTTWENLDNATVKNTFKQYAASLGLNAQSFNSCLDSSKYSDKIQKESSLGSQYGVSGTPTFYIGNQKAGYTQLVGAQPITSFEQTDKTSIFW